MTQTISRIYPRREDADAATAELQKVGFADELIHVVVPGDRSNEQIVERIRQGGVSAKYAEIFAGRIEHGETLVSVQAAFGCAATVTAILQKHSPAETGLPDQGYDHPPPDPATPLSSACGWTVLIDNPTPLSSYLGWRVLSTEPPPRKRDSELVDNPAPFSRAINMPVLTERPTMLSSRFNWRVLLDNPAPLSKRLGWPVLSKQQTPPPTSFGMRLLSNNPAPFSALLGLKTLSNDPAPLSRLLGWRTLSKAPPTQPTDAK